MPEHASDNKAYKTSWLARLRRSAQDKKAPAPERPFMPPPGFAQDMLVDIELCQAKGTPPATIPYTPIAALENHEEGARAYAYKHTGDGNEVRIMFPGRSAGHRGVGTRVENSTVAALVRGMPSRQVAVVEAWINETVVPLLKASPGAKVHLFGHSMGSGNAIAAKHQLERSGITANATILEPFAATQAARHILQGDISKAVDLDDKAAAVQKLRAGITTIRSFPITGAGRFPVGNSRSNNKPFGETALYLSANPSRVPNEGMSRRELFALPAKMVTIPRNMFTHGSLYDEGFNEAGHTLETCKKVLASVGDRSLLPAQATALASNDEILHPEQHPQLPGAEAAQQFAAGYYKALRPQQRQR